MAVASIDDLPAWAMTILTTARVARLGLLDDRDHPRVLPVTFAVLEGCLWTAIDSKPKTVAPERVARLRYLERRPRAALTVDRYAEDWSQLAWVQALGRADVLERDAAQAAADALAAKYEQYGGEQPAGPFVRLRPDRVLFWRAAG